MAVSLKDIAKEIEVSVATVSRSLSNHPKVSPATRARVKAIATEMGYHHLPIRSGKRIRHMCESKKMTSVIALIPAHETPPANSMRAKILAGLSEAAYGQDVSLQVHYVAPHDFRMIDSPDFQPATMRDNLVDGVIFVGSYPEEVIGSLASQFPCVAIHNYYSSVLSVDFVGPNNIGAIGDLFRYLYNFGHRRIGFVSDDAQFSWVQKRKAGYLQSLVGFDMDFEPDLIESHAITEDGLDLRAGRIAEKIAGGVTAWMCANDAVGYDLQRRLKALGIKTPEDVSITGFDAADCPEDCNVLTSIEEPLNSVGMEAINKILNRIRNPLITGSQTLFNCRIVKGESTACVNKSYS